MNKFAITCTELSVIINALRYAAEQVETSGGEINAFLPDLENDATDQLTCAAEAVELAALLEQISHEATMHDVQIDIG